MIKVSLRVVRCRGTSQVKVEFYLKYLQNKNTIHQGKSKTSESERFIAKYLRDTRNLTSRVIIKLQMYDCQSMFLHFFILKTSNDKLKPTLLEISLFYFFGCQSIFFSLHFIYSIKWLIKSKIIRNIIIFPFRLAGHVFHYILFIASNESLNSKLLEQFLFSFFSCQSIFFNF